MTDILLQDLLDPQSVNVNTIYLRLLFFVVQTVVFELINIYIDNKRIHSFRGKDSNTQVVNQPLLDEQQDVKNHQQQLTQAWDDNSGEFQIKAKNIKKIYNNGVCAVNNNSFTVKKGEVLGLLGPNGAGKSSTFGVMTMDFKRTEGEARVMGQDIDTLNVTEHGNKMGMCPQFNPIWKFLTVDQCLQYIGRVKGLQDSDIEFQIDFIKRTLDLEAYSKTQSEKLSGGNKRKLVCAMSLLACPKTEFLDEPTTGVDPVSRRSLFKMLKNLPECAMILTTHRMDEAESLCDNIAIQINGRFAVYGSPGYLKSTYGQGYLINFKTTQEGYAGLAQYVNQWLSYLSYKDSKVIEEMHDGKALQMNYFEVRKDVSIEQLGGLSSVLKTLCHIKFQEKLVIDFEINRSSLEQVFIAFARHQVAPANAV